MAEDSPSFPVHLYVLALSIDVSAREYAVLCWIVLCYKVRHGSCDTPHSWYCSWLGQMIQLHACTVTGRFHTGILMIPHYSVPHNVIASRNRHVK